MFLTAQQVYYAVGPNSSNSIAILNWIVFILTLFFMVYLFRDRRYLVRKAKRDIQQDKHGYDEVFNQVIHFQQEQLVRLEQLTNRIQGPDESYLAFFGATKASWR